MSRVFNGTSDYLQMAANAVLFAQPFSVSIWHKPDSGTAARTLWAYSDTAGTTDYYRLVYDETAGTLDAEARDAGGTQQATLSGTTEAAWNHAGAVYAGNLSRFAYVNGTASSESTSGAAPANLDVLTLGVLKRTTNVHYYAGKLAEVAIYDVALSGTDMSDLASGVSPWDVQPTALRHYWRLHDDGSLTDECSGTVIAVTGGTCATDSDHPTIDAVVGDGPDAAVVNPDANWTWFNDPRVIYDSTQNAIYFGAVRADGIVSIRKLDLDDSTYSNGTPRVASLQVDDHVNPALLLLDDGKILAAYSVHNGDSFSARTTSARDISAWDAPVQAASGASDHAYAHLFQMGDTSETTFWFFRGTISGGQAPRYFRTSTDRGSTWATAVEFITETSQRPYVIAAQNGTSRIDFCVSTGQPSEAANSLYHFYMTVASDGSRDYYQSDGTSIGDDTALPLGVSDMTQVYDGSTNDGWQWDIAIIGGNPVISYATFESSNETHRYYQARWSGSAWASDEITTGGTTATADYLYASEANYSGGVALDPNSADVVFVSREYGAGDWRLEKWTHTGTFPSGTWAKASDISGNTGTVNARPYCPRGLSPTKVLWWEGTYTSYTSFATRLRMGGSATAYNLTTDAGSYALTGSAASLLFGRSLPTDVGSYAVTGTDASLRAGRVVSGDPGSYALTGTDASLRAGRVLSGAAGSYAVTGADTAFLRGYVLTVDAGVYALTGADADLVKTGAVILTADPGVYAVTGSDAMLRLHRVLSADPGSYVVTGAAATFAYARAIATDPGAYVVSGADATLERVGAYELTAEPGAYVITGADASLLRHRMLSADPGTYTLTGTDIDALKTWLLSAAAGSYAVTGAAAAFTYSGAAHFLPVRRTARVPRLPFAHVSRRPKGRAQ